MYASNCYEVVYLKFDVNDWEVLLLMSSESLNQLRNFNVGFVSELKTFC